MSASISTAFVFAAGLGTRMRPLTEHKPKPMVEVLGKPLIDWRLDALAAAGVKRVIINTHYKAEVLQDHLSGRKDMEIILSHEPVLLETGGGLVKALPLLGEEPLYLLNSDTIWLDNAGDTPALERLAEAWGDHMDELLLMVATEKALGYEGEGDFDLSPNWEVTRNDALPRPYVFSSIQIFSPDRLRHYTEEKFSRSKLWWDAKQPDGRLEGIYGIVHSGTWLHIDSPQGLKEAEDFLTHSSAHTQMRKETPARVG